MSVRIQTLKAQRKSLRQIAAVIEAEFGSKLEASSIRKHLAKVPPTKPKRKTRARKTPTAPTSTTTTSQGPTSEVDILRANARRLEAALSQAQFARDITTLSAEHRKTLAAIRAAETATTVDSTSTRLADELRERLLQWLPPSAPTHADAASAAGPPVSDEPRSAVGGSSTSAT